MKRISTALVISTALFAGALPAAAAEQTVTLNVKMWCPSCPYIISRSLEGVPGVLDVVVSYEDQAAVVRFDDDRTGVASLTQTTADIGFPSVATPVRTMEEIAVLNVVASCPSCLEAAKQRLQSTDGVLNVIVSDKDQVVAIQFDTEKTGIAALNEAMLGAGVVPAPRPAVN